MHCPLPHCAWRGNRADLFNSHWQQEDHRAYHAQYGRTPKRSQIETYDPWIILNQIKDGVISIREGKIKALSLVLVKSFALHKANIWTDAWEAVFKLYGKSENVWPLFFSHMSRKRGSRIRCQ